MVTTEGAPRVRNHPFSEPDGLRLDSLYAQLRREEPVSRVQLPFGEPAWLATRLADAKVVLSDPRFSRAASITRDEPRSTPHKVDTGILAMDPPEHSRLRTLVSKAFTARRVELLRPRTRQIAEDLIADLRAAGPPGDFIAAFAAPLPTTVICELFGVPEADRAQFAVWAEAIIATTALPQEQIAAYVDNMNQYVAGLVMQRREHPTDDLLGAMVQARDAAGDRLTELEMIQLAAGLIAAGQETTVSQLASFLYVLLTNPERWEELKREPGLIPAAVEELLRYVPLGVAAAFPRYATVDLELGGVTIRSGEPVLVALHSANRDESVFDRPDEVDFRRDARGHVGFGHGAHHCIGAQLARMELQVALQTLVRELPTVQLAVDEPELEWKSGMLVRCLKSLPISW